MLLLSLQLYPISILEPFSLTLCVFLLSFAEDHLPAGFPTIDMGPQLKVVEKARTATMLCAASGNPDPEISWFKDFLPVDTATSNGRIKQLRSGKVAKQVSLPYLLPFLPVLFTWYCYFSSWCWNAILNSNVTLIWACFFCKVKAVFGAHPIYQDIMIYYMDRLAQAFFSEHHLDSFFCRVSWHCPRSLVGLDVSLPTQQVSATFNGSTVQIGIMRHWLKFYNQWSCTTSLLTQMLQDSALLAVEIFITLAVWHHKNKENFKKKRSYGFQRKVDTVLILPFLFYYLISWILGLEMQTVCSCWFSEELLFFCCTVQSLRTVRPITELKKIKHRSFHSMKHSSPAWIAVDI